MKKTIRRRAVPVQWRGRVYLATETGGHRYIDSTHEDNWPVDLRSAARDAWDGDDDEDGEGVVA